jgi:hypothetical protein
MSVQYQEVFLSSFLGAHQARTSWTPGKWPQHLTFASREDVKHDEHLKQQQKNIEQGLNHRRNVVFPYLQLLDSLFEYQVSKLSGTTSTAKTFTLGHTATKLSEILPKPKRPRRIFLRSDALTLEFPFCQTAVVRCREASWFQKTWFLQKNHSRIWDCMSLLDIQVEVVKIHWLNPHNVIVLNFD